MSEREIAVASLVHAPSPVVWISTTTLEGYNRELNPYLLARTHAREPLMRTTQTYVAWLWLFGTIPIERLRAAIVRVDAGRIVVEQMTTLLCRRLIIERTWQDVGPARCRLVDTLRVSSRFFVPAAWLDRLVLRVYVHRHRRLHQRFGGHFIDPQEKGKPEG